VLFAKALARFARMLLGVMSMAARYVSMVSALPCVVILEMLGRLLMMLGSMLVVLGSLFMVLVVRTTGFIVACHG
jgi:hypothetical protein